MRNELDPRQKAQTETNGILGLEPSGIQPVKKGIKLGGRVKVTNRILVEEAFEAGWFQHLSERQISVLNARYLLEENGRFKTFEEVGEDLHISRARAHEAEKKALNKFRSLRKGLPADRRIAVIDPEKLFDLYVTQRKSIHEVADRLGYSYLTVRKKLIDNNISIRRVGRPRSIDREKVLSLRRKKKMSALRIAKEMKVSWSSVSSILREEGENLNTGRPIKLIDKAELKRLRQQGWTLSRLADRFKVSVKTISRRLADISVAELRTSGVIVALDKSRKK